MRYHNITKDDMLNGDGLRVVLWVAGCGHHCKGCQNPITWDPNGGIPFDDAAKAEIFEQLDKDYISGITFSGGDPLYEANRADVTALAKEIKERYPKKDIWVYTGYEWESVCDLELMDYTDVVVDRRFMETIKIQYLNDEIERLRYIDGKSDWIDLRAAEEVELKAGEFKLIHLGVAMQLPEGYEAHIVPRSSTFKNFGIIQTNHCGLIDESYCGPNDWFYMPAYALRDTVIHVNDRICQFRIEKHQPTIGFEEVDHLNGEDRGGIGSTGKR